MHSSFLIVLILIFHFDFFLRVSLYALTSFCPWMLFTFSIRNLNIWIIVTLNSLSDISKIDESASDACFVSSVCGSYFLSCLVTFWWEGRPDLLGNKKHKQLTWGFTLTWLGFRLCLMFALALHTSDFRFLQYPCLSLLYLGSLEPNLKYSLFYSCFIYYP